MSSEREALTPPYTPSEEVVGMLVVGIRGIRDHDLDEMEWAIDLAAKLEALIDARIRQAGGGDAPE